MLKTYPTSVAIPSRHQILKLSCTAAVSVSLTVQGRLDSSPPIPPNSAKPLSTDATISAVRVQQAPPPPLISGNMASVQQSQTRQQDDSSGEKKQRGGMSNFFTLSYREAAHQWWTAVTPRAAERNVLNHIPYLREAASEKSSSSSSLQDVAKSDPFGQRVWRQTMVQLSGKNRALNEFSVERVGEPVDDTLVMLHGYGAGLGFFFKNFEPLSRVPGWRLYALDMLGMGNSSRPPFKIQAKDPKERTREAESWFIDALEEWRKARNIERFTLLGHSLGGYLAVSYALKYPGHLNKLILASPVGIPEDPWAVNAEMPEPEDSTLENEFTQDQESIVSAGPAKSSSSGADKDKKDAPRRPIPSWLVWLWDANVSPFGLVRMSGPLGPRLVSGWTSRRFNHLPTEEARSLHDYSFSVFRQRGSGEYALPYLLAPGAYARSPVIHRIQDVGRQAVAPATESSQAVRETGIPIIFMYGDHDWMDIAGGYASEEKLKARAVRALLSGTDEEKRRENGSAQVVIIRKAGHHLYLDNPDEFNDFVRKELEKTREETLRRKKWEQKELEQ